MSSTCTAKNTGRTQTCELDHLISIELGGADTLDNIWPQCGPRGVVLPKRFFKQKDDVENYLAAQVRAGAIRLEDAQFEHYERNLQIGFFTFPVWALLPMSRASAASG